RDPDGVWQVLCDALTGSASPPVESALELGGQRGGSGAAEAPPGREAAPDLGGLVTERVRPELADLDLRPTQELVRLMASEEAAVAAAVRRAAPAIAAAIDAVVARLTERPEGRIVYVGAGTAGRMGVLDAAECGPTFNAADKVIALLA